MDNFKTAELVDKAKEYYENNDVILAIETIDLAIINEEYGTELHLYCLALKADFLYYDDQDDEAYELYLEVFENGFINAYILFMIGVISYDRGNNEQAYDFLSKVYEKGNLDLFEEFDPCYLEFAKSSFY